MVNGIEGKGQMMAKGKIRLMAKGKILTLRLLPLA